MIDAVLSGERKWGFVQGNCLEVMRSMPSDSVSLVHGSPPYELARDYLENGENLGIAMDTEEWVAFMVEVYYEWNGVVTKSPNPYWPPWRRRDHH